MFCFGLGAAGRLGTGSNVSALQPSAVTAATVASWDAVTAGGAHTCGIATASKAAYCFGSGSSGQLGTGGISDVANPVAVSSAAAWKQLSAGAEHTCGVSFDGKLFCFGRGADGRLGTGGTQDRLAPGDVSISADVTWTQVSAGGRHSCAIGQAWTGAPDVYCWGANEHGQLGRGAPSGAGMVPSAVLFLASHGWGAVSCGANHTAAILIPEQS